MKIQNKISLIFTVLAAGIILALSVFVYFFAQNSTESSFFHRLEVRSAIVGHAALQENRSQTSIYHDIKERHLGDLPYEKHYVISEPGQLDRVKKLIPTPESFYTDIQAGNVARFLARDTSYVGLRIKGKNKDLITISSATDLYGLEEMQTLKSLLITGFLISLVFVFFFGRFFSLQVFNPIRQIIRNVRGISAHNLNQRLIVHGSDDEIADLSTTFNDMLDRLEITFEMQNNFVSNASHEFKTPLTVISAEAELGLARRDVPPEARESLEVIQRESERLEHLTNSMLNLAQTGFDGKREQWEDIRIDELMLSVKKATRQFVQANRIEINFDDLPEDETQLVISGNASLLKAAFSNIVLNSCKYSDNRPVSITIRSADGFASVTVTDQGIGIPDKEIGQIFVPFFRASNTGNYKGHGIGLPLANNIFRLHHGMINVESHEGKGTVFTVSLPVQKR